MKASRNKRRVLSAVVLVCALVAPAIVSAQTAGGGGGGASGGGGGGGGSWSGSFERRDPWGVLVVPDSRVAGDRKPQSPQATPKRRPKAEAKASPLPEKTAPRKPVKPPRAAARKATVPTNAAPREIAAAEYRPDEILVETSREMPGAEMDGLAQRNRLEQLGAQDIALLDARLHRLRITDGRAPAQVAASLRNSPGIRSAEPNRVFALQQTETGDAQGYAAEKLSLPAVHELSKGTSVLIALIDSGADASHPELAGVIAEQFDAVGGTFTPHAHGTGMAGAIAAHAQLTGAAPQARILNVRAFAPSGSSNAGTTYDILRGLDWAAERRARIFNLSFAGPRDPLISRAIREVSRRGGVIVAAAGNAGPASPPLYPAAEVGVIAATATDLHDKALGLANRGSYVTVAAPGVDILLPTAGGGYTISSGTSIATAYVSGIAALLIARHPETKADEIYAVLAATARDLGIAGRDKEFGAGLVQPLAALQAMEREIASTPALVDER